MPFTNDEARHVPVSNERTKARNGSPAKVIRTKEVIRRVGLSRSTIWRLERAGRFPKRRQLGPNSIGWLSSEIEEWISSRRRRA